MAKPRRRKIKKEERELVRAKFPPIPIPATGSLTFYTEEGTRMTFSWKDGECEPGQSVADTLRKLLPEGAKTYAAPRLFFEERAS